MSALARHPWSKKFSNWLKSESFEVITTRWDRAGGTTELLEMGRLNDRERQTLLFLHGLGNDALFPNLGLFRHLLAAGFNILTSDLDGHGQQLTTVFSDSTISTLVPEMVAHSQMLPSGDGRFHVCGYSLGAALVLEYASLNPSRTKTVSTIGMPVEIRPDFRVTSELITPFLKSYRDALADYGFFGIQPAFGPILRSRYPIRQPPSETESYVQIAGRLLRRLEPGKLLQSIKCPTLYLAGSLDFIGYQQPTAKFLDSLVAQPNFTRHIIRGETHFSAMLTPKTAMIIADLLRKTP